MEANLDASTRAQLGLVWTDDGRLSTALMSGLQNQNDAANAREAALAVEAQ